MNIDEDFLKILKYYSGFLKIKPKIKIYDNYILS